GDDRDQAGGGCRGGGSLAGGRQPAGERAAHRSLADHGGVEPRLYARRGRLSGALAHRGEVLAAGATHRSGLRRPEPRLRVPADRGVRVTFIASTLQEVTTQ